MGVFYFENNLVLCVFKLVWMVLFEVFVFDVVIFFENVCFYCDL